MKHISNYVSTPTLISLYYSLIYPYLIYCNLIWGSTFETHLRSLIILQKRANRVINKVHYLEHTSPLFFSNKILKLLDIVKYRQAVYMYKNPSTHETPSHSYSTRNRGNLIIPFQRLTISQHSLAFCAPNTWNNLPDYLKNSPNLNIFKRELKEYFITSYVERQS